MAGSEHIRRVSLWLTRHGATGIRLEPGGKHPKLTYVWRDGSRWAYVMPATPGDWRGLRNAISDLRHRHGLVGGKRVGQRRKRGASASGKAAQPVRCRPPVVERRDWHEELKLLLAG